MNWYDEYMTAFNAGDVEVVLGHCAETIVYQDFAINEVFEGHEGMRNFVAGASQLASDYNFAPLKFAQDDRQFAAEWLMTGTHDGPAGGLPPTNKPFSVRGATYGLLDESGRILENRDYWNLLDFLVQVGLMPARP